MKLNTIKLIIFSAFIALFSIYFFKTIGVFIALFIIIFFYMVPIVIFQMRKMRKWLNLLFVECDPITYLEIGYQFMNNKHFNPVIIKLNQSVGLFDLGEYEAAKAMLLSLDLDAVDFKQPTTRFVYYCNLVMANIHLGQFDTATELFNNQLKAIPVKNQKLIDNISLVDAYFKFYEGHYEASRLIFEDHLKRVDNNCSYINLLYYLVQIDLKQGYLNQAREEFSEVIDKGNKLYVVELAKQQLEQLNN